MTILKFTLTWNIWTYSFSLDRSVNLLACRSRIDRRTQLGTGAFRIIELLTPIEWYYTSLNLTCQ